jgi:hypothetical protein
VCQAAKLIHVVLDNYAAHKHPNVRKWLARYPRWTFPLHANFVLLAQRILRGADRGDRYAAGARASCGIGRPAPVSALSLALGRSMLEQLRRLRSAARLRSQNLGEAHERHALRRLTPA